MGDSPLQQSHPSQLTLSRDSWGCYNVAQGATSYVQPNAHHPKPTMQDGLTAATSRSPNTCRAGQRRCKTVPPQTHENSELPRHQCQSSLLCRCFPLCLFGTNALGRIVITTHNNGSTLLLKQQNGGSGDGGCGGAQLRSGSYQHGKRAGQPTNKRFLRMQFSLFNYHNSGRRNVHLFGFQSRGPGPFPVREDESCWRRANVSTSSELSQIPSAGLGKQRWARTNPSLPFPISASQQHQQHQQLAGCRRTPCCKTQVRLHGVGSRLVPSL